MIRILVTGFGPFPKVPVNPTAELIARWRAAPPRLPPGVRLTLATFETAYEAVIPSLEALAPEGPFDAAIHFGVSGRARGFVVERRARNRATSARPDARGRKHGIGVIVRGAPDMPTRLPVARLVAKLRRERVPVEVSDDAGAYLCNALFFMAVSGLAKGYAPPMVGFVHVPTIVGMTGAGDEGVMAQDVFFRGAELLLREVIGASRSARP